MNKKSVRTVGGAVLAAMVGVMMAVCTTVVHDREPTVVVKERPVTTVIVPAE